MNNNNNNRTGKVRLNREMVDRAWENGARPNHPDYHPRNPQQSSRGNSYQQGGYSHNNSSFEDRGPRRNFQRDDRPNFRRDDRNGGFQRDDRPNFRRDDRNGGAQGQARPGFQDQARPNFRPDDRNGGAQARPGFRPDDRSEPRRDNRPRFQRDDRSGRAQFEGDYERFSSRDGRDDRGRSTVRPFQGRSAQTRAAEEQQHMTRLPDGRVLKGSRPAQRRQENFWNSIARDTDNLIASETPKNIESQESETTTASPKTPARSPKTQARARRTEIKARSANRTSGPRPSQKGFKWPTQG